MRSIKLEELHWPEVKQALAEGYDTIVFAVGATEQHGPHLPLACDALIGDALAYAVAAKLGNTLVAPTIRVGCSDHHMAFPGTISIDSATLSAMLVSYVKTLVQHGFQRILIIPSHGGNFQTVAAAVALLQGQLPNKEILGFADLQRLLAMTLAVAKDHGISAEVAGIHAGEFETSLLLSLNPELIDMNLAVEGCTAALTEIVPRLMSDGVISVSRNGVLGDARPASASRGSAYLEAWVDSIVAEVQAAKTLA